MNEKENYTQFWLKNVYSVIISKHFAKSTYLFRLSHKDQKMVNSVKFTLLHCIMEEGVSMEKLNLYQLDEW